MNHLQYDTHSRSSAQKLISQHVIPTRNSYKVNETGATQSQFGVSQGKQLCQKQQHPTRYKNLVQHNSRVSESNGRYRRGQLLYRLEEPWFCTARTMLQYDIVVERHSRTSKRIMVATARQNHSAVWSNSGMPWYNWGEHEQAPHQ